MTIYETDRDGADSRIDSEVRCRKCPGCYKALFPALMALLGGSGAIFVRQLAFIFPPSMRRLRRSGDGAAGTQQVVHRPSVYTNASCLQAALPQSSLFGVQIL